MSDSEDTNKNPGFDLDAMDLDFSEPLEKEKGSDETTDESGNRDLLISNLIKKMKKKGDFPSFSKQLIEINKILKATYASATDIADVIVKDYSLTNKLIKLVNSSFYGHFSNKKGITSVSQAMIIIGTDQVQKAAASLIHFEHLQSGSKKDELIDISISSFMSGLIAKELAKHKKIDKYLEEAFLCAMFHNLGQHLIVFYFYEKFEKITDLIKSGNLNKQAASKKILGVTYNEFAVGVGKSWGLPPYIIDCMRIPPTDEDSKVISTRRDFFLNTSFFSNELCRIAGLSSDLNENEEYENLVNLMSEKFELSKETIHSLLKSALIVITKHSKTLNINVKKSKLLTNISEIKNINNEDDNMKETNEENAKPETEKNKFDINKEIKKIRLQLNSEFELNNILTKIIEVMYNEYKYNRVFICIRDLESDLMVIRFGKGYDIDYLKKEFKFKLVENRETIFNLIFENKENAVINDVSNPKFSSLLPKWYKRIITMPSIVLYPIIVNNKAAGFFYADTNNTEILKKERQDPMRLLTNLSVNAIEQKISKMN